MEITPIEFEQQVITWLQSVSVGYKDYEGNHRLRLSGQSGEYEIDIVARMKVLGGTEITLLVECKRYKDPIKRDVIMLLEGKLRELGAHKGIVVSTSGFQSGAIRYAGSRGIATVTLEDG